MRIALVSDAWAPQVNGVVRTLTTTVGRLRDEGHAVETITPDGFATVSCPTYPEIRLALLAGPALARRLAAFDPQAVHIATEGPLGWAARRWCLDRGMPFTTSFHTRFPDYLAMRTRLPADWFWPPVRRFHAPAAAVFAATPTLEAELQARGLGRTHRWSRGVDTALFTPAGPSLAEYAEVEGPILLHVGRVAVEKNIEAFLRLDVPGTKFVVGEGPASTPLRARYPDARFLGSLGGERLAAAYRGADVLVFPSRTDTFGLVMIEALASGTPVAAYPVAGPLDVLDRPDLGIMHHDLGEAVRQAMTLDPVRCAEAGRHYGWAACTKQFLAGLAPQRLSIAA
jgi:glycosyltransferase involved in cell wall biosynthesis